MKNTVALILLAIATAATALHSKATADSQIVVPAPGFSAADSPVAGFPQAWGGYGDNLVIYDGFDGLQIVDRLDGTPQRNLGRPEDFIAQYSSSGGGVWAGFVAPDPDGQSFWVGFTIDYAANGYVADDRIYEVELDGVWNPRGKLTGNFDIDFHGSDVYVSANPRANQSGFTPGNNIFLFDRTGADNHDVIAQFDGNSVGLGVDSLGNIYYGDYNAKKMYRFSAEQVAAAVGPGSITPAQAQLLFDTPGGCYDTDVDAADHLVFNTNGSPSGSKVMVWVEGGGEDNADTLIQIAAGIDSYTWLTTIDVRGDALSPSGTVYTTDYFQANLAAIRADPIPADLIPGDANLDGAVDDADATILASNWQTASGAAWSQGDFDASGTIDDADATILATNWQKNSRGLLSPGATQSVPEPSAPAVLLAVGVCVAAFAGRMKHPA